MPPIAEPLPGALSRTLSTSFAMSTSDESGAGVPAMGLMRVAMRLPVGVRSRRTIASVAADQRVCRAVVRQWRLGRAFEFGNGPLRQHLAELDAPLIERIDVPDDALHEDAVLVEGDDCAKGLRRQPLREQGVGRPVAFEDAVRYELGRRALGDDLCGRLTEGQRFGLREQVGHEQVMLSMRMAERVEPPTEADEIARHEACALVDQLIKRVLSVRAGLAPQDGRGLHADPLAGERRMLAIALHCELL